eukprot:TRINITY_DN66951_c1_g2_i1.p2 TRINITY_DN66951_c1_g2~~TRINITY_DN66951_c1_g2_i1.p2  ORF type:complete len:120 (+),score=4.33 TRINITY_DN66951_c1_g2_i1:98-457(+)
MFPLGSIPTFSSPSTKEGELNQAPPRAGYMQMPQPTASVVVHKAPFGVPSCELWKVQLSCGQPSTPFQSSQEGPTRVLPLSAWTGLPVNSCPYEGLWVQFSSQTSTPNCLQAITAVKAS